MTNDSHELRISVESLRERITSRLIPLFLTLLLINLIFSLARIPSMGFQPMMVVHIFLFGAALVLQLNKGRIGPGPSALLMVGGLALLFIAGVTTLGLLSASLILAPMIPLYLMILGRRKASYVALGGLVVYLSLVGFLSCKGILSPAVDPVSYIRSPIAWILVVVVVGGVSTAYVTSFRLLPTALYGSEERFRLAFENANIGMSITSLDGHLIKVNRALAEMLGYTRGELEGVTLFDITHSDDRELSSDSIFRQQGFGSDKITLEKRYVSKTGEVVWAEVSSSLIRGEDNLPLYFITHVRNVTETKRGHEALRKSEAKFRTIFENVHDVYFETALDGTILEMSPSVESLSRGKYSRQSVLGRSITGFYSDPSHRGLLLDTLRRSGSVSDYDLVLKNSDGGEIECAISARLQHDDERDIDIVCGTIRDITERRKTEELLRRSESRFRTLIEHAPIAIIVSRAEVGMFANKKFAEMLKLRSPEEAVGRSIYDYFAESSREDRAKRTERRSLGLTVEPQYEMRGVRADGTEFPAHVAVATVELEDGPAIVGFITDITERKKAEEALKEQEAKLRAVLENSHDAIGVHVDGKWEMCNPAAVRLFGVQSTSDLIGSPIANVIAPADRARIREYVNRRLGHMESPDHYIARGLRADGSEFDMDVRLTSFEMGGKFHYLVILRDITEQWRAENALRESEERYQRITEAITDYIYTVRVENGRAVQTIHGPGCFAITGYNPEEFASDAFLWFTMVLPEDRGAVEEQAREILAAKNPPPLEHRIRHRNGAVKWVRNTFVLHRNAHDVITAYDGLIQDITERKRAEEALHESESKYRQLVEGFPEAIAIYVEGKIVFVNSACLKLMRGTSADQLIGKSVIEFVHPDYRQLVTGRMKDISGTGATLPMMEEKFVRLDGSVVDVEVTAQRVTFGRDPGVQLVVRDITEKKAAQAALKETELRYSAAVEQSNEGIGIADLEGRYIMVNPALCRMTGYSKEELLTMRLTDLLPPRVTPDLFRRVAVAEGPAYREQTLVRKNGSTFIALVTGSSLEIGGQRYVQGMVQDITEHKKAEEALRQSEEQFHHMFEMHDAVMLLIDPVTGRIRDANKAAEKFYGYTQEALRTMAIHALNAGNTDEVDRERARAVTGEQAYFLFTHRLANGELRRVEVHSSPITVEGSKALFSIIHDITERSRAEEELRKLSLAVEQSPASIVITDTKGSIEYVNPKFMRVSGYSFEEARGKNPNIVKSGETTQEEYRKLWETITAGRHWQGEFHNKRKNGELYWESASIFPVQNLNGVVTNFVAVKEDITERKRSEEALRHAQKLESIGTLAGGIAHDFNNLLNVIMGQSSLALAKLPKESIAGNSITKALKAAERATDLTRQLLAYSGKGKFVSEDFDLNRLVEENTQFLGLSVPKTTEMKYDLTSCPLIVHGDIGQIQQVIMNLIINAGEAIDAAPGTVTVRTGKVAIAEGDAEFWRYTNSPLPPGEYASLQVEDTGHGMRPEILARIFDPFFTTKFTGRGLGLAAVLGITRGHHGGIRIDSTKERGTKFEIVLPLVKTGSASPSRVQPASLEVDGSGRTILVIDDEAAVLELLTDVLTEARFTVLGALNPVEGIELFRKQHASVSMIVLDYSMPGMDGKAAFEALKKIDRRAKVLLSSGYTEEEMKSAFGVSHPDGFIKKPYKPSDLLEQIGGILRGGNSPA